MWQRETYKKIKPDPGEEHALPGNRALCRVRRAGSIATCRQGARRRRRLGECRRMLHPVGGLSVQLIQRIMALYDDGVGTSRRARGTRRVRCVIAKELILPKSENLKVVVLGGDGSTYDMALSSTSSDESRARLLLHLLRQ